MQEVFDEISLTKFFLLGNSLNFFKGSKQKFSFLALAVYQFSSRDFSLKNFYLIVERNTDEIVLNTGTCHHCWSVHNKVKVMCTALQESDLYGF